MRLVILLGVSLGLTIPDSSLLRADATRRSNEGSLIANDADLLVHVALNGTGVVYVLRDFAAPFIATGQSVPLLASWAATLSRAWFLCCAPTGETYVCNG